ncbi:hypothetical protein TPR58_05230 [Sphingomonas sp. HF-S3]|uniref:Uncharacterized protein n=1 Tax=Sphingomonas rustica TaxID=3103142 RepID=A0ABV0B913_9SPHN
MDSEQTLSTGDTSADRIEAALQSAIGEELTDEQLLQMAEGSCSWGANCRG